MRPELRRRALVLWALLLLFALRVAGQLLIALGMGGFLPPWEEWFSGVIPYPRLLASQIVILLVYGKVCLDFTRGCGWFVVPRRRFGSGLLAFACVYLGVMIVRYGIRMTLYPPERWTGGSIPIFFHWVLAAFLLVLASYHRGAARAVPPRRPVLAFAPRSAAWLLVAAGVAAWIGLQLGPTLLARSLDARPAEYAVRVERGVPMRASDGAILRSDVFHPVRAGRTPTILVRIPLQKSFANSLAATLVGRFWAERGYTAVIQGTRGRYESEGRHRPLVDDRRDGADTLAWLAAQPWFDGRVGTWGGSAFGYTQWVLADLLPAPPAGRSALMIQISSTSLHDFFYPGGAFSLSSALAWALRSAGPEDAWPAPVALQRGVDGFPLIEADDRAGRSVDFFDDWAGHPERDAYWQAIDVEEKAARLAGPVLLTAGWFDPFLPGQLADFARVRRAARPDVAAESRLVVGPWAHAESVTLPGAVRARSYRLDSLAPTIPWFDRQLRSMGPGVQADAPVRIYVMGANVWRDEQEWPLARARDTSLYLAGGGRANTARGDGRLVFETPTGDEPPDRFDSDPAHPVPSRGGAWIGPGAGVALQGDVEARSDVLVFTTPPLDEAVEVTGTARVILHVATTAPHADFAVKLVDVHPDGSAYNVTDGILRRAYQASADPAAAAPVAIEIALWPTSMRFERGHCIRIEIAGSNFPRFDRNPQTGEPIATATTARTAIQAVHHGAHAPSRVVLPIVPSAR